MQAKPRRSRMDTEGYLTDLFEATLAPIHR
jgi:hypothetical protein